MLPLSFSSNSRVFKVCPGQKQQTPWAEGWEEGRKAVCGWSETNFVQMTSQEVSMAVPMSVLSVNPAEGIKVVLYFTCFYCV